MNQINFAILLICLFDEQYNQRATMLVMMMMMLRRTLDHFMSNPRAHSSRDLIGFFWIRLPSDKNVGGGTF